MYKIFNQRRLKQNRYDLRQNMTEAEKVLWAKLRNKQLGYKFRSQHGVGRYILDFYCASKRLAIEVDGIVHKTKIQQGLDEERDEFLRILSIMVLRVSNKALLAETEKTIVKIQNYLKLAPLRRGRG